MVNMPETTLFVEAARDREGSYPVRLSYAGKDDLSAVKGVYFLDGFYGAIMSAVQTTLYHKMEELRGFDCMERSWRAPEGVEGCGMSKMHLIGAGFAEPDVLSRLEVQEKTSHDWPSTCLLTEQDGKIKVIPDRDNSMTWPVTIVEEI